MGRYRGSRRGRRERIGSTARWCVRTFRVPKLIADGVAISWQEQHADKPVEVEAAGRTTNSLAMVGAFDGKPDLGWHSEITPREIIDLMMDGTFNGSRKSYDTGIHVATTINARTPEEFEWLDNDPPVETRYSHAGGLAMNPNRSSRWWRSWNRGA